MQKRIILQRKCVRKTLIGYLKGRLDMNFEDLQKIKEILDSNDSYNLTITLSDTENITLTKKKEEKKEDNPIGFK